jgi:hypothetical protein
MNFCTVLNFEQTSKTKQALIFENISNVCLILPVNNIVEILLKLALNTIQSINQATEQIGINLTKNF